MTCLRSFVYCSIILFGTAAACSEVAVAPGGGGSTATTRLVITPGQARLAAVGDTMRLRAGLYDADGNRLDGAAVTWTSADPDIFTIDQTGLVTGRRALSTGRAIASASGRADTAYVVVANQDASPCLGYSTPVALAVGEAVSITMSDGACITSAGGGDEYIVVPWYGTSYGSSTVSLDVTGNGLSALAPSPSRTPLASRSMYRSTDWSAMAAASFRRNLGFERGIREMGRRELMTLAPRGRAEFARRARSARLLTLIPPYLSLGDLVQLNTNVTACTAPTVRTGRVMATSARAIIVADTSNPAGGFTA